VAALTVNKVCGSGLKAVMLADQAIRCGDAAVIVAGGMESMSRAPHFLPDSRTGRRFGHQQLLDAMIHDGLWCPTEQATMGAIADATARTHGVSRAAQDAFAAESHLRAVRAIARGEFDREIVPIALTGRQGATRLERDEGPRSETTIPSLGKLAPAFTSDGTVTAGNASQISDGAAAVLVVNESIAGQCPTPWKARIVASAVTGVEPKDLFIAPVSAIKAVMTKARLSAPNIDLIELNEAFAAQCLACLQDLDLDPSRVNVRGGAIALGHPIGASGARVLVTLIHALVDQGLRRGLASLCLGGGNAVAMIVEIVSTSSDQ
jgi:acetyl-CoA C-acetyltransferase